MRDKTAPRGDAPPLALAGGPLLRNEDPELTSGELNLCRPPAQQQQAASKCLSQHIDSHKLDGNSDAWEWQTIAAGTRRPPTEALLVRPAFAESFFCTVAPCARVGDTWRKAPSGDSGDSARPLCVSKIRKYSRHEPSAYHMALHAHSRSQFSFLTRLASYLHSFAGCGLEARSISSTRVCFFLEAGFVRFF